jgi:CheY-like chemotaxis protein
MLALVVEDEVGICLIYRRVLERLGFEVIEAQTGTAAIELLENHTPQVTFLDMLLPQVNGATVLNFILTTPRLSRQRVVIVSSNRQYESLAEAHPDVVDFVLKPIRPEQIRSYALLVTE